MPDCITAKWAASRLAVSSMHNYADAAADGRIRAKPAAKRRGKAGAVTVVDALPPTVAQKRECTEPRGSRDQGWLPDGYRAYVIKPEERPGRQGEGDVCPVCGGEQSGGHDCRCQSAMQTCLCAVAGSSSSVSMQAARSAREMLKQWGRLRSVAVR
jgi:hypothetical protein